MNFTPPQSWAHFDKKLLQKIENTRHAGSFSAEEALQRHMRLAVGSEGRQLLIYLLVDESDGVIADAKFQAFGPAALIGAAECACELLMRKTYDQASRITPDLIDRQAQGKAEGSAFPTSTHHFLSIVIKAVKKCAEQCMDIPCAKEFVPTPLDPHANEGGSLYPHFASLTKEQKISVIETIIASDIRPYIELDAGGIEVLDLEEDYKILIAYQGACTSCYSATSTTLSAIQEILRAKVAPHLQVIPDASFLKLS
jgi:NifU-like protein